ncbi:DUF2490 domain-containing protein [Sporocytophaga myxococcoides]|uniref:DUF2490 domain-containing protein n=1 Tax=Sporocytophaga myxococcoides TaxID=153721 RepID=UPI00041C62C2|nr:DUF2490 domain-containing protein [Sporocytophaga myxococcoides]
MKAKFVFLILSFCLFKAKAQERIKDYNNVGWYSYFGDHKLSKKFGLHTEYQWRRTHFISTWQQSLARVGVNYNITECLSVLLGYVFVETYPYGDYPTSKEPYPENRIFEDLKLKIPYWKFEFDNRLRLEQRFVAKLTDSTGHKIAGWDYKNRIRYQLKVNFALMGNTVDAKEPYLTAYDEIFIRFGGNTGKNCFDQNRLFIGLGYKVVKNLKFEGGYFFQLSKHEHKEKETGKYVYEYNKGFIISMYYDINFKKLE